MKRLQIFIYTRNDCPDGEQAQWHCIGTVSRYDVFEKLLTSSLDLLMVGGFELPVFDTWEPINRHIKPYNQGEKLVCTATRYLMENTGCKESFSYIPVNQRADNTLASVLYQFTPSFMDCSLGTEEALKEILAPYPSDSEADLRNHDQPKGDKAHHAQGESSIPTPTTTQLMHHIRATDDPETAYHWFISCFPECGGYLQSVCRANTWSSFIEQTHNLTIDMGVAEQVSQFVYDCVVEWVQQKRNAQSSLRPHSWAHFVIALARATPPWDRNSMPIQDVRICNAMAHRRVKTMEDLSQQKPQALLRTPNLGIRSMKLLAEQLIAMNPHAEERMT